MPVIPTTQKAEAGELLEPRREAEVTVIQDTTTVLQRGDRVRLYLKKTKQTNKRKRPLGLILEFSLIGI